MDLRSLRYFEAVYEYQSVSAAARACHISQPSISSALRQLESDLGTQLFYRNARGVSPTESGDRLYPLSKKLTGEAKAIKGLFQAKTRGESIRLGLKRSMGAERMSLLLNDMMRGKHPLELTLVSLEEPCDARIIAQTDAREEDVFIPIWKDEYLVALPSGHPLSLKQELLPEDLKALPFIYRSTCEMVQQLETELAEKGIQWQVKANIRTIEYAQALVRAGVGAALLPDWEEIKRKADINLRPLAGQLLHQTVGLAFQKDKQELPAIQQVLEAVELHQQVLE